MKKAFLSLVAGLLQVACGSNDRGAAIPFTLDAFERIAVSDAAGTVYRNDSLLLGDPQAIRYHPDGYLVLLDRPNTGQVVVIDLETDSVQHLIKRGRGPEEIISVRDLAIRDGAIWVSGLADRKIMKLTRPEGGRAFNPQLVCTASDQFMRAVPLSGERFLTLDSASSGNRFYRLDGEGMTCDTLGSFPSLEQMTEFEPNNGLFQSEITVSPDEAHTAAVCQSLEYIDIYDADMQLQKRLQGPQGIEPAIKTVKTEMGVFFGQDPLCLVYSNAVSDDRQFMVGYIGVCVEDESDLEEKIGTVLSFDWKGRPLKAYEFESDIVSFDMDWENNVMYCLANRPEPEIVIYHLDDLK